MMRISIFCLMTIFGLLSSVRSEDNFIVSVIERPSYTVLSFVDNSSSFQQIFNPSYIEASSGTNGKSGLLARTQNCDTIPDVCTFCGGSSEKASVLTFSEEIIDNDNEMNSFTSVNSDSIVFGPYDNTDSWGTEDPRIAYNSDDNTYYMFYTAYNGSSIYLSLATSPNPTDPNQWTRYGPVFPSIPGSKSGALLIRHNDGKFNDIENNNNNNMDNNSSLLNYLFWGDSEIRVTTSSDLTKWSNEGNVIISTRSDYFDSQLVESGPPPLLLSNGDYIFFYNSASLGWPNDINSAYHVGWVILDSIDPSIIKARSSEPLLSPYYTFEIGIDPYTCNAPNVVFLEAAKSLGNDQFQVYFGGADAVIGTATISVTLPSKN